MGGFGDFKGFLRVLRGFIEGFNILVIILVVVWSFCVIRIIGRAFNLESTSSIMSLNKILILNLLPKVKIIIKQITQHINSKSTSIFY